jgi:hypothetical protein
VPRGQRDGSLRPYSRFSSTDKNILYVCVIGLCLCVCACVVIHVYIRVYNSKLLRQGYLSFLSYFVFTFIA